MILKIGLMGDPQSENSGTRIQNFPIFSRVRDLLINYDKIKVPPQEYKSAGVFLGKNN